MTLFDFLTQAIVLFFSIKNSQIFSLDWNIAENSLFYLSYGFIKVKEYHMYVTLYGLKWEIMILGFMF